MVSEEKIVTSVQAIIRKKLISSKIERQRSAWFLVARQINEEAMAKLGDPLNLQHPRLPESYGSKSLPKYHIPLQWLEYPMHIPEICNDLENHSVDGKSLDDTLIQQYSNTSLGANEANEEEEEYDDDDDDGYIFIKEEPDLKLHIPFRDILVSENDLLLNNDDCSNSDKHDVIENDKIIPGNSDKMVPEMKNVHVQTEFSSFLEGCDEIPEDTKVDRIKRLQLEIIWLRQAMESREKFLVFLDNQMEETSKCKARNKEEIF